MKKSLLFAVLAICWSTPATADVFYLVDFEAGNTDAVIGSTSLEQMNGGTIEAVANPQPDSSNPSATVGRCRIPHGYTRAELSSQRLPTEGETLRYRWSYYIPTDFFDGANISWLVNAQWKTWPCEVCNSTYDPAICGSCAGIFNDLRIESSSTWDFWWRAEPDCHEHSENLALGQWVRFEMLVKWTKDSTGFYRLWREGLLIDEESNIRTLFTSHESPRCDMYWAVGLYADWSGNDAYLELFIDNIEISDELAPPVDAGVDAGEPDSSLFPDATPVDGGTSHEQRCRDTYGSVQGFLLCEATATSCSFNAQKDAIESCDDVCQQYGGACVAVYGNGPSALCTAIDSLACDLSDHLDDICVCSLPGDNDAGVDDRGVDPPDSGADYDSGTDFGGADAGTPVNGTASGSGCTCRATELNEISKATLPAILLPIQRR